MATSHELYGTERCPYTREMRDWLEFRGCEFVEYDVENDPAARARMKALAGGQRAVPVLVEAGRVVELAGRGEAVSFDSVYFRDAAEMPFSIPIRVSFACCGPAR